MSASTDGILSDVYVLTHWKIVQRTTAAGEPFSCLCGHVFGHQSYPPGTFVQTSAVRTHRVEFDSLIVTTNKGSDYWLAGPDPREPYARRDLLLYLREKGSRQLKSESESKTQPLVSARPHLEPSFAELLSAKPNSPKRRATDKHLLGAEDANWPMTQWAPNSSQANPGMATRPVIN